MDRRQPVMHAHHHNRKKDSPDDKPGDRTACLNRMHRIITENIGKNASQRLENEQTGQGNHRNRNQRRQEQAGRFRDPFAQSCFNEGGRRTGQQRSKDAAPSGDQRTSHKGNISQSRRCQQSSHSSAQRRGAAKFFAGIQTDKGVQHGKDGSPRQLQILDIGIAGHFRTDFQQQADQSRQQPAADECRNQRDKDVADTLQHPFDRRLAVSFFYFGMQFFAIADFVFGLLFCRKNRWTLCRDRF